MGYIKNFFESFKNADNDGNIPDIETLPNNQKKAVSPDDMQTLIKSSKKMPNFVESLRKTAMQKEDSTTSVRPKKRISKEVPNPPINERDGRDDR